MKPFLIRLGIFIALILVLCHAFGKVLDRGPAMYNLMKKLSVMESKRADEIIIFGDSRANLMNLNTVPRCYNYAMSHWEGFYPYTYLLQRYLRYNPPPKAVILSFVPETLCAKKHFEANDRTSELFRYRDILLNPIFPADLQTRIDLAFLKSLMQVNAFYQWDTDKRVVDLKSGFVLTHRDVVHEFNDGFRYLRLDHPAEGFQLSATALKDLEGFLEFALSKGITPTVYFMPIAKPVYEKDITFYNAFRPVIMDLQKRFPHAVVIDPYRDIDLVPVAYTWDGTHLNGPGATYFNNKRFPQVIQLALAKTGSRP